MINSLEVRPAFSTIESERLGYITRLNYYLANPNPSIRPHQLDAIKAIRKTLSDNSIPPSGHLDMATGTGKTVIAVELARILNPEGLVVFSSPTKIIHSQILKEIGEANGKSYNIANYFSDQKDDIPENGVVNTIHNSLGAMIDYGLLDPGKVKLLIIDEVHTFFTEGRIPDLKRFKNAITLGLSATPYFPRLEEFIERGIIKGDEPWLSVFTNKIFQLKSKEAMHKGIQVKPRIFYFDSNTDISNVKTNRDGQLDQKELSRLINEHPFNLLTLAMLKGPGSIDELTEISDDLRERLKQAHEQIKGKRTAIFGFSINHIKRLQKILDSQGISAEAIHSFVSSNKRKSILDSHKENNTQVLLGVEEALGLGWDSPETEVGIFLRPYCSLLSLEQQLGRTLRPSPDTGKENAIAIQFVYHSEWGRRPILIHEAINQNVPGSKLSNIGRKNTDRLDLRIRNTPIELEIHGLELSGQIDELPLGDEIFDLIYEQDLVGGLHTLESLGAMIRDKKENYRFSEFFYEFSDLIPQVLLPIKFGKIIESIKNKDDSLKDIAINYLFYLSFPYLRQLINRSKYQNLDIEEREELVTNGLVWIWEAIPELTDGNTDKFTQRLLKRLEIKADNFIKDTHGLPDRIKNQERYLHIVKPQIEQVVFQTKGDVSEASLEEQATKIAKESNTKTITVLQQLRLYSHLLGIHRESQTQPTDEKIIEIKEYAAQALQNISEQEREALVIRYGISSGVEFSTAYTAKKLGLPLRKTQEIIDQALIKLRHDPNINYLYGLDD